MSKPLAAIPVRPTRALATRAAVAALMLALAAAGRPAAAQGPLTTATAPIAATGAASSPTLNLDRLLSDPVADHPPLRQLEERRRWLAARGGGDPAKFEQVAAEFEKQGAYYPAIELLWFAEKLTDDAARRGAINDRMRALTDKAREQRRGIDAALQVWAAGGPAKAIEQLQQIVDEQPFNELAYFERGYRTWLSYLAHDQESNGQLSLESRARLFRACYESFLLTLAIDPLYNDAYYQLNQTRSMLGEIRDFQRRTEELTARALTFRSSAVPAIGALDDGKRAPEDFIKAADALAEVAVYPYAVYAYQAALAHAKDRMDLAKSVQQKIDAILKDRIAPHADRATRAARAAGSAQ